MLMRFLRDRSANVASIFALTLIPLLSATGAAVDYSYAFRLRTITQDSLDAAALAGGRMLGLKSDDVIKAEVDKFFVSNVANRLDTIPTVAKAINGATITLTTTLDVPTHFLKVVGLDDFHFPLSSQVTSGIGTLEVAIVVDTSGSMLGSKLTTLKTAATNLTTTLYGLGTTSTKTDPIKVGLVPFAGSVNVGTGNSAAAWMDTTQVGTHHGDAMDGAATTINNFSLFTAMGQSWGGCVEMRPTPNDAEDTAASTGSPGTMFVPMFAPDEPDSWTCTTSNCTNYVGTTNSTRRYTGAPTGTQSYNNYLPDAGTVAACGSTATISVASPAVVTLSNHKLAAGDRVKFSTSGTLPSGINNSTMYYVLSSGLATNSFRISTTSGGSAVNTSGSQSGTHKIVTSASWTCQSGTAGCGGTSNGIADTTSMQKTCKYTSQTPANITVGGIPGGPNFMCNSTALTPLTTTQATVTTAITNLVAAGSTNIQEGLMWGWRILSSGAPFTEGRDKSVTDNKKIIVLMTDGANTYYPKTKYTKSWYAAWGYGYKEHLGVGSGAWDSADWEEQMNDRTELACANAQDDGVIIYTVAFDVPDDSSSKALLEGCASDPSYYYDATNETELLAAFSAIGDSISLLRISH